MWQLATWQVATSFLACRWRNCAIGLPAAKRAQEGPMGLALRVSCSHLRPFRAVLRRQRCPAPCLRLAAFRRNVSQLCATSPSRLLLGNKLHPGHSHLFSQHHACGLSPDVHRPHHYTRPTVLFAAVLDRTVLDHLLGFRAANGFRVSVRIDERNPTIMLFARHLYCEVVLATLMQLPARRPGLGFDFTQLLPVYPQSACRSIVCRKF